MILSDDAKNIRGGSFPASHAQFFIPGCLSHSATRSPKDNSFYHSGKHTRQRPMTASAFFWVGLLGVGVLGWVGLGWVGTFVLPT